MYRPLFRTLYGRAPARLILNPEEEEEKPRTKKERWDDLLQFIQDTKEQYDPEEQQNKSAYEQHKGDSKKKEKRTEEKEKEKEKEKPSRKRQKTS